MRKFLVCVVGIVVASFIFAQENYEIQVYGSKTMEKRNTIFELHSNFTFSGEKNIVDHVMPTHHSLRETLEITHGITENFETGFYLFTNFTPGYGYKFVGWHIRPRVMVPEKWNWPVGVSLSTEFGYQKRQYSEDTWNIEVRLIVDKQAGNFYFSFNPTFGIGIKPDSNDHTPEFEPNFKAAYTINNIALGFEYYGDLGKVNDIPGISGQEHFLFLVADFYFDPRWELNIGPGFGLTNNGDDFIFKVLVGRRINWNKK